MRSSHSLLVGMCESRFLQLEYLVEYLIYLLYLLTYLILDDVGLSKQMLLNAPLCTIIETILEIVY